MTTSENLTTVFDYQVEACQTFFQEELPGVINELRGLKNFTEGRVFDITGFDGQQVVALLSYIVNERDWFEANKTFYLLIKVEDKNEVFELIPNPQQHQPGNGVLLLRKPVPRRKSYHQLNNELNVAYKKAEKFAELIKQFFKNNKQIFAENFPQATIEVYMLWLFEIARRLVKSKEPSSQQMKYDILPIGSAIASLVRLLKIGDADRCCFKDVFLQNEKFHCFTGEPEQRERAVHEINNALLKEKSEEASTEHFLEELQEMFCSDERLEKLKEQQLAEILQDLKFLFEDDSSSSEAKQ